MAKLGERVEKCYEVREVPFGEVRGRGPERVALECGCRARLILVGQMSVQRPLECGVCGERFVVLTRTARHRAAGERQGARRPKGQSHYSWLGDYQERLRGREARHEYYARLEQAVSHGIGEHACSPDRRHSRLS